MIEEVRKLTFAFSAFYIALCYVTLVMLKNSALQVILDYLLVATPSIALLYVVWRDGYRGESLLRFMIGTALQIGLYCMGYFDVQMAGSRTGIGLAAAWSMWPPPASSGRPCCRTSPAGRDGSGSSWPVLV